MRPVFNVLEEGWIPVLTLEGKRKLLGIRETLVRAHELREISVASPLEEYGLYRFLGVFLMDALRPETEEDLEDLLEEGRFNGEQIDAYIDLCRGEGVSFDLFDEKQPFLQSAYDGELDTKVKSVSVLDPTIPSGNNHTHFDHRSPHAVKIGFDRGARLVIALQLFCTAGAQGYPSSVNGSPPYYGVVKGKNLFETAVYTLLPIEKIDLPIDEPPVLWRSVEPVMPKKTVGRTSWLRGMLFPARRVCLIPAEEENVVLGVYLSQGENYVNKESWHDPYVTYRTGKDAVFPFRPNGKRAIWTNYNDLLDIPGNHAEQLLRQYFSLTGQDVARVTLYGVETSQASYLGIYKYDLQFPARLADSQEKIEVLTVSISDAEKVGRSLSASLSEVEAAGESAARLAVQRFYSLCEGRFWKLCDQLLPQNTDARAIRSVWCDDVGTFGLETFRKTVEGLRLRASDLAEAEEALDGLRRTIWKLKKEAGI